MGGVEGENSVLEVFEANLKASSQLKILAIYPGGVKTLYVLK